MKWILTSLVALFVGVDTSKVTVCWFQNNSHAGTSGGWCSDPFSFVHCRVSKVLVLALVYGHHLWNDPCSSIQNLFQNRQVDWAMDFNELDHEIPRSNWFAAGLLDGTWSGGKVTVAVSIELPMPKIHLVHVLAEQISKKNEYRVIDTCFAYCPDLDLFLPFASSVAAANCVQELFDRNKEVIVQEAIDLINASFD